MLVLLFRFLTCLISPPATVDPYEGLEGPETANGLPASTLQAELIGRKGSALRSLSAKQIGR